MTRIERIDLLPSASGGDRWPAIAEAVGRAAVEGSAALRDAVVLVPSPAHLPLARAAFAAGGAWMPRIETRHTLAASLGPETPAAAGALTFDAAADRLIAARMLRSGASWTSASGSDPRVFRHAIGATVRTAHELARAAFDVAPAARPEWWSAARDALRGGDGLEPALARLALEWAETAAPPATDRLFAMRPSAWFVVDLGADEAWQAALLACAAEEGIFAMRLRAAPPEGPPLAEPRALVAADFEEEAQWAAARVLEHLAAGEAPVALVAEDRQIVRRVRALLARQAVSMADETGWRLSTTRAGAAAMAALRAAAPDASLDDWTDWVKSLPASHWPDAPPWAPLESSLATMRIGRVHGGVPVDDLPETLADAWRTALRWLDPLSLPAGRGRPQPLLDWLDALGDTLRASGSLDRLAADRAGIEVLAALRIAPPASAFPAFHAAAVEGAIGFDEFVAWVDAVLEARAFRPWDADGRPPQVVVTPLRGVPLRPFAALVFPGVDAKRFGASAAPHPLLGPAQLRAIGLPASEHALTSDERDFAHAMACPAVTLIRRRADGSERLGPSPIVRRAGLAWRQAGRPLVEVEGPSAESRASRRVSADAMAPPLARAPGGLPASIGVNACDALRACPYRFFSRVLLALHERRESGEDADRRDYGSWLHELLDRFHRERAAPREPAAELEALFAAGEAVRERMRFEPEAFQPFASGFPAMAENYVRWLHERDAEGIVWDQGEVECEIQPPGWPVALRGRIDRIDRVPVERGEALEIIDYKTGSLQAIGERVRQPLEDTQLAGYAAMLIESGRADEGALQAAYLSLSERRGIQPRVHDDVAYSAGALVAGLGGELTRVAKGEAMQALGEGLICESCEARGLCRRDHWTAAVAAADADEAAAA